jgi:DNA-binding XRE family transcriptional regulator
VLRNVGELVASLAPPSSPRPGSMAWLLLGRHVSCRANAARLAPPRRSRIGLYVWYSVCMKPAELKRARKALGLTQESLARRIGVAPNTVARWERGELAMPLDASRLIDVLEGIADTEVSMRPTDEALRRLGEAMARAGLTADEDEAVTFLSESQAATRLGLTRAEVKKYEKEGRLKALRQPFGTSRPGALVVTDKGECVYPEDQVVELAKGRRRR